MLLPIDSIVSDIVTTKIDNITIAITFTICPNAPARSWRTILPISTQKAAAHPIKKRGWKILSFSACCITDTWDPNRSTRLRLKLT